MPTILKLWRTWEKKIFIWFATTSCLLFRGSRSRSEVVATFLAVLELCKARVLHLAGSETDCIVRQERDDVPENLTF